VTREQRLERALRELVEQIDSLDDFTLTRDLEPYKAEACWNDAYRNALDVLALPCS
jgi:hypothetical protein